MSDSRNPLTGSTRAQVDVDERAARTTGVVVDHRRTRPRYFDGRFLAARDLTAEQHYVLRRQADLGRASGWGVVSGLNVREGSRATTVRIGAGHGVTPAGEPVILPEAIEVDLAAVRQSELLDGHLGLRQPRTPASRVRTGAFVVALRPVEYTANPRRGYPTSIQGSPTTEDHDIVEATAVTLVPWSTGLPASPDEARRALAREVFTRQTGAGLPADLVPVAMVYLDGVAVRWVDEHLVRRTLGAEQGDLLGIGGTSRAARLAFVRQHQDHVRDVIAAASGARVAAADAFEVLPPVGELPPPALDRFRFTQGWFPPEVDVDVSFVPRDELGLLVEESLMLPPIDLHADADTLAATAVLVLVPVERARLRAFQKTLETVRRPLVDRNAVAPSARTPLLALSRLKVPRPGSATVATVDPKTAAWTNLLGEAIAALGPDELLWYVRRRNVSTRADIEGRGVDIDTVPSIAGSIFNKKIFLPGRLP